MTVHFAYPEQLRFECTRCGDCCRGWHVMVSPEEEKRLQSLDWQGRVDELVEVPVATEVPGARGAPRRSLTRRDDGACVFLGPSHQCRIHEHFGEEQKPLMCRLFPFGFYPMEGRVAVDVSFACRSISEGQGAPLSTRVPEWAGLLGAGRDAPSRHLFSKKFTVDGELLFELETDVVTLIRDPSLPFAGRVHAVAQYNRLATTSDPTTDAARQLRQVMVRGVPKQIRESSDDFDREGMDKTQRAVFHHLMFLYLNPTPVDVYRLSGKKRKKEADRRVQAADGYKYPKARPWVSNRELDASFEGAARVSPGFWNSERGVMLLERYFEAKVIGQRFMREGEGEIPFVEAIPRLLLLYPMLLWTGKALAAERRASEVGEQDARAALRLLDRAYGEIPLSQLPPRQRKAWHFVLMETELLECAVRELRNDVSARDP